MLGASQQLPARDRKSRDLGPPRNDFEFSMLPDVKEREHDPQRNFGLDTARLQRAVDREAERTASRYCSDALKGIGPVGHRHINFRGIL
jgi:hypothetical protein